MKNQVKGLLGKIGTGLVVTGMFLTPLDYSMADQARENAPIVGTSGQTINENTYAKGELYVFNKDSVPSEAIIYGKVPASGEVEHVYFADNAQLIKSTPEYKEIKDKKYTQGDGNFGKFYALAKDRVARTITSYGQDRPEVNLILYEHVINESGLDMDKLFIRIPAEKSAYGDNSKNHYDLQGLMDDLDITEDIIDSDPDLEEYSEESGHRILKFSFR